MDPTVAAKTVASLDAELSRHRQRRDADEEARWLEESGGDCVVFARRYLDRLVGRVRAKSAEEAAEIVMASVGDDADRAQVERVEQVGEWIVVLAEKVEMFEQHRADEAAGIVRKCGPPKIRVRSIAKLLPDLPRLDPAAPQPRRRNESTPATSCGMPISEDFVWLRGQVQSFNPRDWSGSVRSADGKEFPLSVGVMARNGLTTLIVGMRCEFRIAGREADWIKSAWH
jgi:hypothetical protein